MPEKHSRTQVRHHLGPRISGAPVQTVLVWPLLSSLVVVMDKVCEIRDAFSVSVCEWLQGIRTSPGGKSV